MYVPPGSFLLNDPLYVNVSRVVIRGAGPSRSTLLFGRSLGQIYKGSWAVDACSGWRPGGGGQATARGGVCTLRRMHGQGPGWSRLRHPVWQGRECVAARAAGELARQRSHA